MATINPPGFGSTPITEATSIVIPMVETRPNPFQKLADPVQPNTMIGYYNNRSGFVELFVADASGQQYIEVG